MSKIRKKPIILFLIVLVALYVVIYVVPKVTGALQSTYTVEYGELQTYDKDSGYFVRNEQVYLASNGGSINTYMKEGKLVRKGTTVMAVSGDSDAAKKDKFKSIRESLNGKGIKSYVTQSEGIVSYTADGYETKLTPDTMVKKNYDYYKQLKNSDMVDLKRDKTSKGDPVFKLCDRSTWYIVCYLPKSHKDRYVKDDKIDVELDGDTDIVGRVYSVTSESGKTKLIVSTDYYYSKFATERVADVKVITSDAMGLIVYNTSIARKNGHEGVYVKQTTGNYKFVRINVISTDGKKSAISKSYFYDAKGNQITTVKNYDEVLKKAK
jgi:hypothetical protein